MTDATELDGWTLTTAELGLVLGKRSTNRLGLALLLRYFGAFGRFPRSGAEIPADALRYVADQLGIEAPVHGGVLQERTTERYRAEVRAFFGFREATDVDAEGLTIWLRDNAVSATRDRDQLTELLEVECRRRSIEPPAPDSVGRIVRSAIHAYEERFYEEVHARLSPVTREQLDALLQAPEADGIDTEEVSTSRAIINGLRSDPGRVGVRSIRRELAKLEIIRKLELPADLFDRARPHELELYRQRVAVETPRELRRHPEAQRLTWVAAFAYLRGRAITDTLVDLLNDTIHRINSRADRRVSEAFNRRSQARHREDEYPLSACRCDPRPSGRPGP